MKDLDYEPSHLIKFISSDGKIFEIKENCLKRSGFFNELKDILNLNEEIPLARADSKNLCLIIEYLNHYENEEPREIPKPLPGPDLKPVLSEWDYNFIMPLTLEETIDLVNTANYLNIPELVNLASARLAYEMINCTIEEAREKFGIKYDMTEEEIQEMDNYPLD